MILRCRILLDFFFCTIIFLLGCHLHDCYLHRPQVPRTRVGHARAADIVCVSASYTIYARVISKPVRVLVGETSKLRTLTTEILSGSVHGYRVFVFGMVSKVLVTC